jgi:hypothetical protein
MRAKCATWSSESIGISAIFDVIPDVGSYEREDHGRHRNDEGGGAYRGDDSPEKLHLIHQ